MAKVLEATFGPSSSAMALYSIGSQSSVYVEFRLAFNQNALDSGYHLFYFLGLDGGSAPDEGLYLNAPGDQAINGLNATNGPFGPQLDADTWYTVRLHVVAGGPETMTLFLDGADIGPVTNPGYSLGPYTNLRVGAGGADGSATSASKIYYDDIKVSATAFGSTDLFTHDFESGVIVPPFGSTSTSGTGALAVIDDPFTIVVDTNPHGISIAFDDPTLEPDPTWTRIDSTDNFVASGTIDRGRSFELDRMDTGRATIRINDQDGILDPTNTTGPYFGKIEPLLQVAIALHDPVADTWTTIYRGFIDDYSYDADPSQSINFLTLSCVDAFEILTAIEMLPDGTFGDTPASAETGNIVFAAANVDDRIFQALANAGWPSTLATIFSGNVSVQRTVYSPGQSILEVIQEASDAEFPGLAIVYVSAEGKVTFHGRKAKFDPVGVAAGAGGAWTFTHWKSGDGTAVNASPTDTAHIRGISGNRGLSKIINSAIATPKGIKPNAVAGQVVTDSTSIGIFGVRSWSATDLITEGGLNDSLNADDETQLFAQYYVDNYKVARDRISQLTFKSMWPDDIRAGATWDLLCNAELSDLIDVTVDYPGGGGFTAEPFFIEGIHYQIGPATPDFPMVTLTLDVSPQSYFTSSPFTGDT